MFVYCLNNPVRYVDSEGREAEETCYSDDPRDDMFPKMDGAPTSPTVSAQSGSQSTTNSSARSYSAPPGGGGVSHSITVGNTTVLFGHGGRHMDFHDISGLETAIAHDVVTKPPTNGYRGEEFIIYNGTDFTYRYFTLSQTSISIGTYFYTIAK